LRLSTLDLLRDGLLVLLRDLLRGDVLLDVLRDFLIDFFHDVLSDVLEVLRTRVLKAKLMGERAYFLFGARRAYILYWLGVFRPFDGKQLFQRRRPLCDLQSVGGALLGIQGASASMVVDVLGHLQLAIRANVRADFSLIELDTSAHDLHCRSIQDLHCREREERKGKMRRHAHVSTQIAGNCGVRGSYRAAAEGLLVKKAEVPKEP